jgi:hypothetical protein
MDEFSWGNTRLVVGEGKEKKVIINEDEKFDESMIPLKKFSGTSALIDFPTVRASIHPCFVIPSIINYLAAGYPSQAHVKRMGGRFRLCGDLQVVLNRPIFVGFLGSTHTGRDFPERTIPYARREPSTLKKPRMPVRTTTAPDSHRRALSPNDGNTIQPSSSQKKGGKKVTIVTPSQSKPAKKVAQTSTSPASRQSDTGTSTTTTGRKRKAANPPAGDEPLAPKRRSPRLAKA